MNSVRIKNKNNRSDLRQPVIHLMPCKINHNSSANVSDYFEQTVKTRQTEGLTASFRGRPLCGAEISVPEGYTGVIAKEVTTKDEDNSEEFADSQHLQIINTFQSFKYWNLDRETSEDDSVIRALKWIDLANVIHSDIAGLHKQLCDNSSNLSSSQSSQSSIPPEK